VLAKASNNLPETEKPTPLLIEEEAPFENTQVVLKQAHILSWVLTGSKTKNGCADKGL
jgi:hypothetical protein